MLLFLFSVTVVVSVVSNQRLKRCYMLPDEMGNQPKTKAVCVVVQG